MNPNYVIAIELLRTLKTLKNETFFKKEVEEKLSQDPDKRCN
jgi:hypothetical protein